MESDVTKKGKNWCSATQSDALKQPKSQSVQFTALFMQRVQARKDPRSQGTLACDKTLLLLMA